MADRYVSSVIAYHSAVHKLDMAQVRGLLASFQDYLVRPDRTFHLRCSTRTLSVRMAAKGDVNKDDHDMMTVPGRLDRLRANFDEVAATDPTGVTLETDDHSPEELADLIGTYLTS
ncbi:hypothetical protein [Streptomyces sp. TS71-3]|uniref:hypothetical protein n=1 Tax=Streptomyces sp. TS71-3 TaxID=2733862 RepID=UPI002016CB89|nr:hypothetical protein [Streptomyces sp. TS71-3]